METICISPPPNFSWIEESLCRSCMPNDSKLEGYLSFLKSCSISTILNISGIELDEKQISFFTSNFIIVHQSKISVGDELNITWIQQMMELLLLLLSSSSERIWIIGSEITYMDCLLVACIRKLQNWSFTSIIGEFRLFSGTKRHFDLEQLIEMFDHSYIKLDTTKCSTSKIPKFLVSDIQLREQENQWILQNAKQETSYSVLEAMNQQIPIFDEIITILPSTKYDPVVSLVLDKEDED